jgi:LPS sulfotransferase NodH
MPASARICRVAACLAAAALLGCGGGDNFVPRELAVTRLPVSWATTDLRETYTVRSDAQWQAAWQAHEPRTTPPAARPAVDFSRQMVLGLTRGTGPNGCYGLSIQRVVEHADQLLVHYAVSTPSGTAACTQALVALTDFVVVERLDKPVSFVQAGG